MTTRNTRTRTPARDRRTPEPGRFRADADARAVLCSHAGTFAPSGDRIGPALNNVERLAAMLSWARSEGRLTEKGTVAQVWIVGATAVEALGWLVEPDEALPIGERREQVRAALTEAVAADLYTLEKAGWSARDGWERGGYRIRLEHKPQTRRGDTTRTRHERVDVILEPFAWTTAAADGTESIGILGVEGVNGAEGWALPDDEDEARAELGRRLCWCVHDLGQLPDLTAGRTGASVQARIWRTAEARNRDIAARDLRSHPSPVPRGPVPIPPLEDHPRGRDLEPAAMWARAAVSADELDAADRLIVVDQRASYLASVAMMDHPVGSPVPLDVDDPAAVPWLTDTAPAKWPAGLWRVLLPPAHRVPDWDRMPPIHPRWWQECERDRSAVAVMWVHTETLKALATESLGGYGIDWCRDNIALLDAWTWPDAQPIYQAWQKAVADGYKAALRRDDNTMRQWYGKVYKAYIGAWSMDVARWGEWRVQHHQPVAQAGVHAHARTRARRQVKVIAERTAATCGTAAWPLTLHTDALAYLVPRGADIDLFTDEGRDLDKDGNPKFSLGRLAVERWCELTDSGRAALAAARNPETVSAAVAAAFADAPTVHRGK